MATATDGGSMAMVKSKGLSDFLPSKPKQLLINGKWVPAKSGKTFESINPANEEVIGLAAEGDKADIDAAVAAARKAFEEGKSPSMSPNARSRMIQEIAVALRARRDEFAELIPLENGKPLRESVGEAIASAEVLAYYAGWPNKIYGDTNPSTADFHNYTLREPVGVCGQIIPWNAPLQMIAWKLGPALACGNTVVLKPAEQTPLVAIRMAELLLEVGLPEGVVNIVTGYGETAGAALVNHPDVDKVAFTGSTAVGREILRASAGNMKRVSLELGGKSPNVIFADADMNKAVVGSAMGIFSLQGQVCVAASRMFVEDKVYDRFAQALSDQAAKIKLENPLDPATTMGPLISKEQHDRVLSYLEVGKREGAKTTIGGSAGTQDKGYFVQPTVFTEVNNGMRIAREEIFGPVASVIRFKDENDVVLQGNDTEYGLGAAVWTKDLSRAHKVARRLKSGTVWVNCYLNGSPDMPFGGYKQSGFGRELGKYSIDLYTQIKSVFIKL
ncbi:MAG TPA: aldehyde dehydrogenase family protein [Candidatus Binataceae bacterium]|nr:aldehyde dehydrogenase family protein [Candidatus Binataceae bacterium]